MSGKSSPLPPPMKIVKMVGKRRVAAYKPVGVKYPSAGDAMEVVGKPDKYWSYSVPWSNEDTWIMRYDRPDGSKRYKVITQYRGGWYIGWPPTPYMLFAKNRLINADTVYVCEGEKTANYCSALGLPATTSMGGPFRAALSDWSPVEEKHVVILPDEDEPGRKYAQDVAQLVLAAGALSAKIVTLPGLDDGQDLCDWVASFEESTTREMLKARVEELVALAEPIPRITAEQAAAAATGGGVQCLSAVEPVALSWVWEGLFAKRAVTVIEGEAGVGKSLFALEVAAAISRGERRPNDPAPENPVGTILFLDEDDLAMTVRPRLDRAKANTSMVFAVPCRAQAVSAGASDTDEYVSLFDQHLLMLENELTRLASESVPMDLVIVDPLGSFVGLDQQLDAGQLISRLTSVATRFDLAIVVIRDGSVPSNRRGRPSGSGPFGHAAMVSAARCVWSIVRDRDVGNRRMVLPVKMNLCEVPPGLGYTIHDGRIQWEDESLQMTAMECLDLATEGRPKASRSPAKDSATEWLKEQLAGGPAYSKELEARAAESGICYRTLRRAADDLGCVRERKEDGRYSIDLPSRLKGKHSASRIASVRIRRLQESPTN